ncbi:1-deoxy-D-xylulose-5-phosphate synthase [Alicyclobacillus sp. ALC3]|uniref:1-deoxy-D-xylulose-5-phosphate synthase n=1 Tax=Alicyclobacillus sp. ALC3 TaxID=2796143 RepID=UPI0023784C82|nr:1-deoxy-D-xylulose-5-phosphate synthase [Alicyclobacillus sp. ALC3]WDL98585.1 1-deoxy-D-xylulose-5-phosphate synthase [Alicyclobacillus sp. ALC3]
MLLERVNNPGDLKNFTTEQLEQLAVEIRDFLVESVSKTGGHFGANLGVVELTLALHKVYDSPTDKLVWDVGHQAYVHKVLTGRRDDFAALRKHGGLAGFPKRNESEHDQFGTGHASTSISAALGMAVARDLNQERHQVVCVIGDGALTGGMAMEALNHAGDIGTDLTVVLNDNEMSIAPNVGALSRYLTKVRADPTYSRAKTEVEQLVKRMPGVGPRLTRALERVKDSLRSLVIAGQLFEAFGFKYFGPIDGHDLPQLVHILEDIKRVHGPILLHVVTAKGKGYASAEEAPDKFHAWPSTAKKKDVPGYTEVFAKTLIEFAKKDPRIVAVTAAMPSGTGLNKFADVFPHRTFDVGIAEQHAATFCAGLATAGKRPVFAVYSTFLQRAYDQVIHDVCIQNLPVMFAIDRAGFVGPDGETHQGMFDLAYLRTVPNMTVMMPKDENELRNMLWTGLHHDGPSAVRYAKSDGLGVAMDKEPQSIPLGQAEVVRTGGDVAILALGPMVQLAEQVADQLRNRFGTAATVVNMRFVKPLDAELVCSLARRGLPLVTVEEASLAGGMGSAVLETLAAEGLRATVLLRGVPDRFIEHGSRNEQLAEVGLTTDELVRDISELLDTQPKRSASV